MIPADLYIPTEDGRKAATPAWFRARFAAGSWPAALSPTEWGQRLGVVDHGLDLIRAHLAGFDTALTTAQGHAAFQAGGWLDD